MCHLPDDHINLNQRYYVIFIPIFCLNTPYYKINSFNY